MGSGAQFLPPFPLDPLVRLGQLDRLDSDENSQRPVLAGRADEFDIFLESAPP